MMCVAHQVGSLLFSPLSVASPPAPHASENHFISVMKNFSLDPLHPPPWLLASKNSLLSPMLSTNSLV